MGDHGDVLVAEVVLRAALLEAAGGVDQQNLVGRISISDDLSLSQRPPCPGKPRGTSHPGARRYRGRRRGAPGFEPDEVIDERELVAEPGFLNIHWYAPMTLERGPSCELPVLSTTLTISFYSSSPV
jgi:hypothetical protein